MVVIHVANSLHLMAGNWTTTENRHALCFEANKVTYVAMRVCV